VAKRLVFDIIIMKNFSMRGPESPIFPHDAHFTKGSFTTSDGRTTNDDLYIL